MKLFSALLACANLLVPEVLFGQTSVVATASEHEQQGKFKQAAQLEERNEVVP